MSTDSQIEQEIKDKGLTAPRVTPADIEDAIVAENYCTAFDAMAPNSSGANRINDGQYEVPKMIEALSLLTICVLVLRNGFTVLGKSACASPENFNAELGRKIARQDAVNQMWPLLGYALKEKLAREPQSISASDVGNVKDVL